MKNTVTLSYTHTPLCLFSALQETCQAFIHKIKSVTKNAVVYVTHITGQRKETYVTQLGGCPHDKTPSPTHLLAQI
jgi:hypothetical protein